MKITHLIKLLSLLLLLSISNEAQLKRSKYSLLSSENEQELNYENSESHIYDHILGFFSAFSSEVSQSKEGVDIIASTRPECSEKSLKTLFTYGRINYVKYLENVQKATQNEKPQQSISERIRQCELHKKELLNEIEALVLDDPDYFYNILPYTYALGISEKWINNFEKNNVSNIDINALDYYESNLFMVMSE